MSVDGSSDDGESTSTAGEKPCGSIVVMMAYSTPSQQINQHVCLQHSFMNCNMICYKKQQKHQTVAGNMFHRV